MYLTPPPRTRVASAFLLAAWVMTASAHAQVFESVGARALGMAGAFVGVADDGTATYWNPAGLGASTVVEACAGYGRGERRPPAEGTGAPRQEWDGGNFCLAIPVIAFSFNSLQADSPAGGPTARVAPLRTSHYGVSLAQTVVSGVTAGATFRIVSGPTTTFDADLGVMAAAGPMRLGLTVRNLRAPSFSIGAGETFVLARQVRLGVAWTPGREAAVNRSDPRGLVLALDVDVTATPAPGGDRRNVAAGVERWWWGRRLGLRAGARASTTGPARPVAAGGVSVGLTKFLFLEAAGTGGHPDGDRGWFAGIRAGL